MKRALILGCGRVGIAMARDLAVDAGFDVSVADADPDCLARMGDIPRLSTVRADLSRRDEIVRVVAPFDVVLGALPSALGFAALRAVIEAGKPYVDISFMAQDATELDALARERGTTAVFDCGVAPGLPNLIVGHLDARLDALDDVLYVVGGLPFARHHPYEYKAPFAPGDVLEEYTRPARMIEHGRIVSKPAMSEPELMDFPRIGTLEAFNTDGLRSLLTTVRAPNMKEKTLRYPGHRALMEVLRDTGLLSTEPIDVGGARVRPRDVTARLLFPRWRLGPGEREFTLLRVVVEGRRGGRRERHTVDLFDETDPRTGLSSMARTTGFPCAIVARMLVDGTFTRAGVFPPEILGRVPGLLERVLTELAQRDVTIEHRVERPDGAPDGASSLAADDGARLARSDEPSDGTGPG